MQKIKSQSHIIKWFWGLAWEVKSLILCDNVQLNNFLLKEKKW